MREKEDMLIETIRRALGKPGGGVIRGIGDDAAVLAVVARGKRLLLTSDMLVDGVHFRSEWATAHRRRTPAQLGWKSLAVNLSDIAAMGGTPRAALVSLGLPADTGEEFVRELYGGMKKLAKKFGVDVVGGDTVRAPSLVIDVAVCGEVEEKLCVYRSGAKVGDIIMVTGALGDSAAGLRILGKKKKKEFSKDESFLIKKHLQPTPRILEGREAAAGGASAMMDLSDGLAADLPRLTLASGAGARILAGRLPVSPALRRFADEQEAALIAATGGEDYELLICAPENKAEKLARRIYENTDTKVTAIGEIVPARRGCRLVGEDGKERPLPAPGFSHFK